MVFKNFKSVRQTCSNYGSYVFSPLWDILCLQTCLLFPECFTQFSHRRLNLRQVLEDLPVRRIVYRSQACSIRKRGRCRYSINDARCIKEYTANQRRTCGHDRPVQLTLVWYVLSLLLQYLLMLSMMWRNYRVFKWL